MCIKNNTVGQKKPVTLIATALIVLGISTPVFGQDDGADNRTDAPPGTVLELTPGETLTYAPGEAFPYFLSLESAKTHGDPPPVYLHVEDGVATQQYDLSNLLSTIKTGQGTLVLAGSVNHMDTHLQVEEGGLHLSDHTMVWGPITVGSESRLSGAPGSSFFPNLKAITVQDGGRLEPGLQVTEDPDSQSHHPANLYLSDWLILEGGSTLALRTWASGAHDSVRICPEFAIPDACTGQLGGRLLALPQGTEFDWDGIDKIEYKNIVTAAGTFKGSRFDTVESALPWLKPTLSYSEDDMSVSLTLAVSPLELESDPKEPELPDPPSLDPDPEPEPDPQPDPQPEPKPDPRPEPDPDPKPEIPAKPVQPDPEVQLEPESQKPEPAEPSTPGTPPVTVKRASPMPSGWGTATASWLVEDSRFVRQAINDTGVREPGLWVQGFHAQGERRGGHAYDTGPTTRHIEGLFLGFTAQPTDQWRLGGLVGGSHSRMAGKLASSRIQTTHAGLYAQGRFRLADVTLGAALSHHRLNSRRTAQTSVLAHPVSYKQRAQTRQVFGRLALNAWGNEDTVTRIQPFVEGVWLQHHVRASKESGGPLALNWNRQRHTLGYTSLGLDARHKLDLNGSGLATLQAQIAYRQLHGKRHLHAPHHYRYDPLQSPLARARMPTASGPTLPRHRWDISFGLNAQLNRRTHIHIGYAGSHGRKLQDHGVQLVLRAEI